MTVNPWPRTVSDSPIYRPETGVWFVASQTEPGAWWQVRYHCDGTHVYFTCGCPAGRTRGQMGSVFERPCRHVLAVSAAEADDGVPQRPSAPTHISALVD